MALIPEAVVDKSALTRLRLPTVKSVLEPMIQQNRLATCPVVDLEVLFSARNGSEWLRMYVDLEAMPTVPINQAVCNRAIEVQGILWNSGKVRSVGIADLLIAAAAEIAGLPVLHYDSDFDVIASVSDLESSWVVPAGTAD